MATPRSGTARHCARAGDCFGLTEYVTILGMNQVLTAVLTFLFAMILIGLLMWATIAVWQQVL